MESALRAGLHTLTLTARRLLTDETAQLLEGAYGLHANGRFEDAATLPAVTESVEGRETRARLEQRLADAQMAGLSPREAREKLVKETAYTWLNRIAAFKMLEARKLNTRTSHNMTRGIDVSRGIASNGFKLWLTEPENIDDYDRYQQGTLPADVLGEGPRDVAYRHYLLHCCAQMEGQVRELFNVNNLHSRLFPRPRALADLLALVNAPSLADAWTDDETIGWVYRSFLKDETIGWVYQYFNEEEKAEVLARLNKGAKVRASEIAAVTELFTPRWIVQALAENSLGRLWLQMHPDSRLREHLTMLVPNDTDEIPTSPQKLVREITLLDPACGTMHFGLVAFDIFAKMYQEEMDRAGEDGWPIEPSVVDGSQIAASIIEHNLFGIDLDQRAVQLSALTLYLKARTLNPNAIIRQSNLACADIQMLNEARLEPFLDAMPFPRLTHEPIVRALWSPLREASPSQIGSLLRLETQTVQLISQERSHYRRPGQDALPFDDIRQLFGEQAVDELLDALEDYLRQQYEIGKDESYFVGEMTKGVRVLNIMRRRYDVVVTNPPYLDSGSYNDTLKRLVAEMYPAGKRNLFAAFIIRCLELVAPGGRVGMVTPLTFMAISSYEELRKTIRNQAVIEMLADMGYGTFPGVRVDVAMFVLRREPDAARRDASMGTYLRLVREPDADAKETRYKHAVKHLHTGAPDANVYRYRQGDFDAIPGAPWVYQITPGLRRLFQTLPKLGEIGQPRQGLATADNFRFLRYWWEIGPTRIGFACADARAARATGKRWFPHMKGGEFRRWWGNQEYVVNWEDDGDEIKNLDIESGKAASRPQNTDYYFRRGVTFPDLTAGALSMRLMPIGFVFDHAGNCIFPNDDASWDTLLGICNAQVVTHLLSLLNSTIHYYIGDFARLPIPTRSSEMLGALVERAIALARAASTEDETTYEFVAPPAWPDGAERVAARLVELASVEREIDEEVYRLYAISAEDRATIEAELAQASTGGAEAAEGDESGDEEASSGENADSAGAEPAIGAPPNRSALARRWVSYAVGVALGRFAPGVNGALGNGVAPLPAPEGTPGPQGMAWRPLSPGREDGLRDGALVGVGLRAYPDADVLGASLLGRASADVLDMDIPAHRDANAYPALAPLDAGHPDDLTARVIRALEALVGDDAVEVLVAAATDGKPLAEWLATDFFKEHVRRYRKRPIYWLLQSPSKTAKRRYSAYVWSERVTRDTLHLLRGSRYLGGRIERQRTQLAEQRAAIAAMPQGAPRRHAEHDLDALESEGVDLEAFDRALAAVTQQTNSRGETVGWAPELDDGVLLNLAPLHSLLPAWSAEPRAAWGELTQGAYDWSQTAMRYWPDRVLTACQTNRSYALAHGLAFESPETAEAIASSEDVAASQSNGKRGKRAKNVKAKIAAASTLRF